MLLVHLLLGPFTLLIALVFRQFPPKKINNFYGYRTSRSMKNEDIWEEANRYSSNLLVLLMVGVVIFQAFAIMLFSETVAIMSSTVVLVLAVILLIPLTEMHLNKYYDKDGNPKR